MSHLTTPYLSRTCFMVMISLLVGGFFYAQGVAAQAQKPDLKITTATFDGRNLHLEYLNATGVGYPKMRYEVGFQWYDTAGKPVGGRRWFPVPGVERGGVAIFDTKYQRTELSYRANDGRIFGEQLPYFITHRPDGAVELRVTVDDGDRVSETDERNNIAALPFAPPDLQISDAKFTAANRVQFTFRNAKSAAIEKPFQIGFTWVDDAGKALAATRQLSAVEPEVGKETSVDSANAAMTGVSFLYESGRQGYEQLKWYLERRPAQATQLRITMDDTGVVTESNEQNNVVLLRSALPDLVVRDAKFTNGKLTFTYGNAGEGYIRDSASRVLFQWRDVVGQPVGSPRWYGFAQMDPKQMFTVNAERFDVDYTVPGTTRTTTERLATYISQRPQNAIQLSITIDDEQRIVEANEANNGETVTLPPPPQPDLTIVNASLVNGALMLTVRNDGKGIVPAGQPISLWFEWVNAADARVGALAWVDIPAALSAGNFVAFDGNRARFMRERAPGTVETITLADLLQSVPDAATHLKVRVDGPNTIRESDETNNVALLKKPILPVPDLAFVSAEIQGHDDIKIEFENGGNAPVTQPLSLWLEWVDARDQRIGDLYWTDYRFTAKDPLAPGKRWRFNRSFTPKLSFARGTRTVQEFLAGVPETAKHLKIRLDGPDKLIERDEGNNIRRLPAPEPLRVALPDLLLRDVTNTADKFRITIVNDGDAVTRFPSYAAQWLDAKEARLGELIEGDLSVGWSGTPKTFVVLEAAVQQVREDAFIRLLKNPPTAAAALEVVVDPRNTIRESNENNNTVRLMRTAPRDPDLVIVGATVEDGYLTIDVRNKGSADAVATDIWLQWYGKGRWQEGVGAVDLPAVRAGATEQVHVELTHTFGYDGAFLSKIPKDAERLRLFLDGKRAVREDNEENNAYMVERRLFSVPAEDVSKKLEPKKPEVEAVKEKPDLTIDGAGFLPVTEVIEKDRAPFDAIFTAIVSNQGKKDSGQFRGRVRVDLGSNGSWDAVSPLLVGASSLAAGGQALVEFPLHWNAAVGAYTFEICVDPGKNIDESDETNNCESGNFTLTVGEEPGQEEEEVEVGEEEEIEEVEVEEDDEATSQSEGFIGNVLSFFRHLAPFRQVVGEEKTPSSYAAPR